MSWRSAASAASPAPLVLVMRSGPPWYGAMCANTLIGVVAVGAAHRAAELVAVELGDRAGQERVAGLALDLVVGVTGEVQAGRARRCTAPAR
jgi:hypothetical protein